MSIFELPTFEIDGMSLELLSKVFDHKWSRARIEIARTQLLVNGR